MSQLSILIRRFLGKAPEETVQQIAARYFGEHRDDIWKAIEDLVGYLDLLPNGVAAGTSKREWVVLIVSALCTKLGLTKVPGWVIGLVVDFVVAQMRLGAEAEKDPAISNAMPGGADPTTP